MKTTTELIERISPRYKELRNKKLDFLWEDFLQAVEKAIEKVPDEQLAAASGVSIFYFTEKGNKNIYRSKTAECYFFDSLEVEYQEDDVCLGTREELEIAFVDFKAKAKQDSNLCTDWFEVEELAFDEDGNSRISLDFKLPKNL